MLGYTPHYPDPQLCDMGSLVGLTNNDKSPCLLDPEQGCRNGCRPQSGTDKRAPILPFLRVNRRSEQLQIYSSLLQNGCVSEWKKQEYPCCYDSVVNGREWFDGSRWRGLVVCDKAPILVVLGVHNPSTMHPEMRDGSWPER
jgi:hypothetical protein